MTFTLSIPITLQEVLWVFKHYLTFYLGISYERFRACEQFFWYSNHRTYLTPDQTQNISTNFPYLVIIIDSSAVCGSLVQFPSGFTSDTLILFIFVYTANTAWIIQDPFLFSLFRRKTFSALRVSLYYSRKFQNLQESLSREKFCVCFNCCNKSTWGIYR